jgi:hypothetical protein
MIYCYKDLHTILLGESNKDMTEETVRKCA